ncbi:MAG TPA: hypothetical protein VGQ42_00860 [Candidatus Dormibacteraeota bacterium]|jgi:hypothetical protein|nr:hypothetical protein [Candidatus Dormibacteraeota bacterium]
MPEGERPAAGAQGAPEDPQLFRLKAGAVAGSLSARRTVWTVLSGLLVAAAGVILIAGALLPWISIAGQSVAAVREGGPDGAAATIVVLVGIVCIVLGVVAAVGRRGAPRFLHWLTLLLAPIAFALVQYRSDILGKLVFLHNADIHTEGAAVVGPGITVVYAGIALALAAPLLSLRQALRALRT